MNLAIVSLGTGIEIVLAFVIGGGAIALGVRHELRRPLTPAEKQERLREELKLLEERVPAFSQFPPKWKAEAHVESKGHERVGLGERVR